MTKIRNTNNGRPRGMEESQTTGCQPSLCVAYLVLTGTSGWALKQTSQANQFAFGAFSFLLGHSLIGFLHTTHPNPGRIIRQIFKNTSILAEVAPLAMINAEIYLVSGFQKEFAYAHLASALLPLVANNFIENHTREFINITLLGNLASLAYIQVVKESGVWTGGLIALAGLNHFVFKQLSSRYSVPKNEIVTIGLSFFNVFALNVLYDLKV